MMMRAGHLPLQAVARAFETANADVVISLDYPPLASDDFEIRRLKYARTINNFAFLSRKQLNAHLAPVIHGISRDEIHGNCEAIQQLSPNPHWVCVGGLVPLLRQSGQLGQTGPEARSRLREIITLVRGIFKDSLLHVLGAGSPRTMLAAFAGGADSVDSIGWRRAAGFGTIFLPGGTERFVAPRERKRTSSRPLLTEQDREALHRCGCPACTEKAFLEQRIEHLAKSYIPRAVHNAWVVLKEAEGFR